MKSKLIPILLFAGLWFASCRKDNISFDPSLRLTFSTDTVLFDTVFTTIGSATRYFKVYNNNKSDIQITSVKLQGGSASPYRMNVDGEATSYARDVLVRANDSIFVFVDVTVNPTDQNSPLLIPDSIVFEVNGNNQDVKLVAWGQDVHLLNSEAISGEVSFAADKPYLIYNYLYVEPNAVLSIEAGARLHFHYNAWLYVEGRIEVNGEPENPIMFEGDRLEPFYRDKAGQWGGIWLSNGSIRNNINWAEIKNAIVGINIHPYATPNEQTLTIHNSKVINMSYMAIDARGATIEAGNCLFANASESCLSLGGGQHKFYHCTIANYWGQYINRKGPALVLANYYIYFSQDEGVIMVPFDLDNTHFANCIVYGSRDNELAIVTTFFGDPVNNTIDFLFENSLLKVSSSFDISNTYQYKNVITENPKFKNTSDLNFELDTLSPAKDYGLFHIAKQFPFDLNNISRLEDGNPDLGAYERQELP